MSGIRPPRWDAGSQNERTALAWRRTATALAAVVLLLGRTALDSPALAAAVILCGLSAAAAIAVHSDSRYRRAALALHAKAHLPGGLALLLCSAMAFALGVLVVAGVTR